MILKAINLALASAVFVLDMVCFLKNDCSAINDSLGCGLLAAFSTLLLW